MPTTYDTLPLDARLAGVLHPGIHVHVAQESAGNHPCLVHHVHPSGITIVNRYGGSMSPIRPDRLALDMHDPLTLHRLADWLAAGQACPTCEGTGAHPLADAKGQTCPRCRGTGHLRPPTPMWWPLPRELGGTLPALWSRQVLGWSAESVGRGGRPIRGVLPAWTTDEDGTAYRLSNPYEWTTRADAAGWACSPGWDIDGVAGPETGPEGRTRADAAALDSLYALAPAGEDEPLTLPPLATETTT